MSECCVFTVWYSVEVLCCCWKVQCRLSVVSLFEGTVSSKCCVAVQRYTSKFRVVSVLHRV